jgi:trans-aconitate methyltransferase
MKKKIDEHYWIEHYSDISGLDGIGNKADHADYVRAFFEIEGVKIKSLFDMGFGHGYLLKEMAKKLKCSRIEGIEPSEIAFRSKIKIPKAKLSMMDLKDWCQNSKYAKKVFDLGMCTSVFQYIPDKDLQKIVPVLKKRFRYLYITVPTDIEYQRQREQFNFVDEYAYKRSQQFYYDLFSPHFTFIGLRILESKLFFDEETTDFQDLLFRF